VRKEAKFHGLTGRLDTAAGLAWLLLPQTWMNESGSAVGALMQFHKIAAGEILVAHDELDLPPGGVKIKQGGGHAGHNGLRDIIASIGTQDFWRLRIGIGHPRDVAASEQEVADFVLHAPRKEEHALIDAAIDRGAAVFDLILATRWRRRCTTAHQAQTADPKRSRMSRSGHAALVPDRCPPN